MPAHEVQRFPSAKTRAIIEITSLEAGSPWRTGDGQLGKLSGPLRGKDFSAAVAETGYRNTPTSSSLSGISPFVARCRVTRPTRACAAQRGWEAARRRLETGPVSGRSRVEPVPP